jgi:ribosomal protein S18 acetylase RimI-like enzyme
MWVIRNAGQDDREPIWTLLEPIIRAGETYSLPRDMGEEAALSFWFAPDHEVFVAAAEGNDVGGTYFIRANQRGGGDHVANCAYAVADRFRRRGVGRALCSHSLDHARLRGYRAVQFNFVVETNEPAVNLWSSLGFKVAGRLPKAFLHPRLGLVDAFVMFLEL